MDDWLGIIAVMLLCGLFADGLLMKHKIKDLAGRVKNLERAERGR